MFDTLQEKLEGTFAGLRSKGKLTEDDIAGALREIRLALLEADVNFKVVKSFVATVKDRLADEKVHEALQPAQQIVKVVNEELVALMGTGQSKLTFSQRGPTIVLMAGLQGSGKTTTTAKLAKLLREQDGKTPALVACDVYRPAAIDQLKTVGAQVGVPVYEQGTDKDPVEIAKWGVQQATDAGADVIIVDTAGRLDIDEQLMGELVAIKKAIKPHNVLLVLDSMTGQEAVSVAERFDAAVAFDGVILTKLDGDARGGAALSVKSVTGKPIKFVALGEQLDALEYFHPDRMASRILGMGDVLTLIEKAEQAFEEDEAADMEARLRKGQFTFDDFLKQMKMMRRMGSFKSILALLPGIPKEIRNIDVDERQIARIEAIVLSMTKEERGNPDLIDGSRRRRIAAGSGHEVQAVNQLIKQFGEIKKMMKMMMKGGGKLPPGFGGDGGAGGGFPGLGGPGAGNMPAGGFPGLGGR
ncbi:MAG: signal recognition particle protein [Thermoleophilia bacterium]|nr:signal recognition particle protein [Thermoleophilia bacterium]